MGTYDNAFHAAFSLIFSLDPVLWGIIELSLRISLSAVAVGCVIALPLGAAVALWQFPGRGVVITALNALMGLPPVVAGLMVYLLLSRAGPLGEWGLLFTPTAMVIAQAVLVTPIIAALTRQVIEELWADYREQLQSFGVSRLQAIPTLLFDARFTLVTVVLAGFGRASAEVGAVLTVGGNIDGVTRVMTTAIALETHKGNLPLALGLGMILLFLVAVVSGAAYWIGEWAKRRLG